MAVKLIAAGEEQLFPLTSPPSLPDPKPSSEIIAKVMEYKDRQVLVTHPFPDKLSMICDVMPEHLTHSQKTGSLFDELKYVDNELTAWVKAMKEKGGYAIAEQTKYWTGPKASASFNVKYDPSDEFKVAFLKIERRKLKAGSIVTAAWSARLEFNPSKIGPSGLVKLTSQLSHHLSGALNVLKLLPDMRVTRVDIAVDCYCANPLDLIVRHSKPGKRQIYTGNAGRPESIYFFEKKPLPAAGAKPHKSTGRCSLKIYERTAYCKQMGLPLPCGTAPVTRVELTKRWNTKKPTLAQLGDMPNPFKDMVVAYAAGVGGYRRSWRKFCMERFGGGQPEQQLTLDERRMLKKYESCGGDVVDPSTWLGWETGLSTTGLMNWMALI